MKTETRFSELLGLIALDAEVVGPNGRTRATLVLDTAAALTTLVPRVSESIGYASSMMVEPTITRSAVAVERGYSVLVSELSVLGVTIGGLKANVAELGYGIDGLLGMNFLRHFNFEVRPAERRIFLERIVQPTS